jgi:hypothetical protein
MYSGRNYCHDSKSLGNSFIFPFVSDLFYSILLMIFPSSSNFTLIDNKKDDIDKNQCLLETSFFLKNFFLISGFIFQQFLLDLPTDNSFGSADNTIR